MEKNTKKAVAIGLVALAGVGLGGIAGANLFPVEVEKIVVEKVPEPFVVEKIVEVEKIVTETVEVPFEVTNTIVVQDTDFAQLACDRLLYEDLTDCMNEVKAEDAALAQATFFIEDNFNGEIADEMEDLGLVDDEDDVELIKIYKDFEDVEIVESDFDDDEYEFKFKVKVNDDDDKKFFFITVSVKDGETELEEIEED